MIGLRPLVQLGTCISKVQLNFYQTTMASLLVPPSSVCGTNKLDYEAFKITVKNMPCVVLPVHSINKFRGKLQKFLLKLPNFKAVQTPDPVKQESIIYLDPDKVKDISDTFKEEIDWNNTFKERELVLSYENWRRNEVLRKILPGGIEVPTSHSLIGHIVHLNLRDEQLPYKHVIGQVLLDKIPNARTVVNKLDNIDNTYRNFAMEILAGEKNTVVCVKEHGHIYHFDFAKVYWNPRLSTEHVALVKLLKTGDVLYDVFAGVGPFAVPAASKGIRVLANDLNPESYKWLLKNSQINKKVSKLLTAFNKDGRDFLRDEVKTDILDRREKNAPGSEHMSMNLPALAVEFLDVFSNWLTAEQIDKVCSKAPTIHVYCFVKSGKNDDLNDLAKKMVEEKLGSELSSESLINIHHVRNVAPNKDMMRVSFLLTKEILKREEPAEKKLKLTWDNVENDFLGNNGQEQDQSEERV